MFETSLFQGEQVSLTAIRPETDAQLEARWMHDPDYFLTARRSQPFRVQSAGQLKQAYEEEAKSAGRLTTQYQFAIRRCADEELVGFLRIPPVGWSNRAGALEYRFASPAEEARFGLETLRLAQRFAFEELNLHRLTAYAPEHLDSRVAQLLAAGFLCEARRRQVIYRAGRLWDELVFGILDTEWSGAKSGGAQ